MADELVFYTNPMSRGRIVRWMLEEVGQPYRTELLEYGTTMKAPEYLRINPMGKVPALRHGDAVVTEAAAICAYLGDAFPEAGLAPPPRERLRGPYYRWLFFAAGPLEAAASNKAFGFELPAERRAMAGYGSLADVLAVLDAALAERASISSATASPRRMSTSARISAGGCGSARSRRARHSSATSSGSAPARPRSGHARSMTPWWRRKRHRPRDRLSALRNRALLA